MTHQLGHHHMPDFDRIEEHVHRGDPDALDGQIERVLERLADEGFEDSFKGVFQQEKLPTDAVDELISFLAEQRDGL